MRSRTDRQDPRSRSRRSGVVGRLCTERARADEGAAIVAAVALMSLLLVAVLVGGALLDLLAARQRAAAAADLGALAGAPAVEHSAEDACRAAAWVVRMNGATLRVCTVTDGDVRITASARPRGAWSRWLSALLAGAVEPEVSAHAGMRAGPGPR